MSVLLREEAGSVRVSARALSHLVVHAAEAVDGVRVRRARRHLVISVADGHARVTLELAVRMGVALPEAARQVQERVAAALRSMCAVAVDAVDVTVEEVV